MIIYIRSNDSKSSPNESNSKINQTIFTTYLKTVILIIIIIIIDKKIKIIIADKKNKK